MVCMADHVRPVKCAKHILLLEASHNAQVNSHFKLEYNEAIRYQR